MTGLGSGGVIPPQAASTAHQPMVLPVDMNGTSFRGATTHHGYPRTPGSVTGPPGRQPPRPRILECESPLALAGPGVLTVRDRIWNEARDSTGTLLNNFSVNGTSSDGALQGHLGAGFSIQPVDSPIGLGLEGRATALLHNYSSGPLTSVARRPS